MLLINKLKGSFQGQISYIPRCNTQENYKRQHYALIFQDTLIVQDLQFTITFLCII